MSEEELAEVPKQIDFTRLAKPGCRHCHGLGVTGTFKDNRVDKAGEHATSPVMCRCVSKALHSATIGVGSDGVVRIMGKTKEALQEEKAKIESATLTFSCKECGADTQFTFLQMKDKAPEDLKCGSCGSHYIVLSKKA